MIGCRLVRLAPKASRSRARVEQKGLALADPGGQAINRLAFAEHFFHYHA
jgi:hypothetical protein